MPDGRAGRHLRDIILEVIANGNQSGECAMKAKL